MQCTQGKFYQSFRTFRMTPVRSARSLRDIPYTKSTQHIYVQTKAMQQEWNIMQQEESIMQQEGALCNRRGYYTQEGYYGTGGGCYAIGGAILTQDVCASKVIASQGDSNFLS